MCVRETFLQVVRKKKVRYSDPVLSFLSIILKDNIVLIILFMRNGSSHIWKWHSRIPGVPGIRTTRHSVTVPGMEPVGTVCCPYVSPVPEPINVVTPSASLNTHSS